VSKHIHVFGPLGILYWVVSRVAKFFHKEQQVRAKIPQSKETTVSIRLGTSDLDVFHETFVEELLRVEPKQPVAFVIDGGAYVGYTTLYFALRYPNARVVAVEPEITNYRCLVKNTRACSNVMPLNAALWGSRSGVELVDAKRGKWGFFVQPAANPGSALVSLTIPDILKRFKAKRISILKLDVEGAEKSLFDHSKPWIHSVDCLIVELHDHYVPGCRDSLLSAIDHLTGDWNCVGEKVVFRARPDSCRH
jgi:FkbM family methyltransferase